MRRFGAARSMSMTRVGAALGGGAVVAPVNGDATSFTVSGPGIVEPDTNGKGIFAEGWTATMVFKGLSPNANVNMFNGQQVTISVTDPGFTTAGGATTVSRTIKGAIALRRPYNNNLQRKVVATGSDLSVLFALEDVIYQGTTINSVTVGSGVYAGANSVVLSGPIAHTSTRAYPKPHFVWLNRQFERATGSTFHVESYVAHRHGRNGQMVACVEYVAKDPAANVSSVQRASAAALSTIQTQGNIAETWQADIPLSALNQTTSGTGVSKVHAKVYPWIGNTAAILDTEVDGVTWPSPVAYQSLQFVNDKTGGYGGGFAYVQVGASGGSVSTVAATARAAPFPTFSAAITAAAAWNNTNRSHNDHSGTTIRLMDDGAGGAVVHGHVATNNTTAGLTWSTIEADPLNTAAVSFRATNASSFASLPDLIAIGTGVTITQNPNSTANLHNAASASTSTARLAFDGCSLDVTGATGPLMYGGWGFHWVRNVTLINGTGVTNANRFFLPVSQSALAHGVLALGCVGTRCIFPRNFSMIGCQLNEGGAGEPNNGTGSVIAPDGGIWANNSWMNVTAAIATNGGSYTWGSKFGYPTRGLAFVQNVYEHVGATGGGLWNVAADDMILPVAEYLDIHNTAMGNRGNTLYSDISTSAGIEKRGVTMYSLWLSKPTKCDPFCGGTTENGAPSGRAEGAAAAQGVTGNWEWAYHVGSIGTVVLLGAANESSGTVTAGADPNGSLWQGMYWPPSTVPALHTGTTYPSMTFVSDKVGYNGAGGTGGSGGLGDYHLTGASNPAYARVPAGRAMLKCDLGGALRKNDGNGAVGAYERTDI